MKTALDLMPQEILDGVVIPAVRELGWEKCPWSDDSFATQRIFPGAAPRTGTQGWKNRLTVTELSMELMWKCQIDRRKRLPQTGGATKTPKVKMDELAEHAALVHWLAQEVQGCVPVSDHISMEKCILPWKENDTQLHLEISSALATKADDFSPTM